MEILTEEQFIETKILYNAFDSSDYQEASLLYQAGNKLSDYLEGLPADVEWKVGINGYPVEQDKWAVTDVRPEDKIIVVMVPQGGGAKSILRMVAMVALVVVAAYLFAPVALGGLAIAGTGWTAMAAMAVTMVAGSLLINALLPPQMPEMDASKGQNYGYDGAKNTAREGVPIPIVYGEFRVAGNYVDLFTENQGNTQYLHGRTVLSEGIIDSVTDIELNEQPIANWQNVQHGVELGGNTATENIYFGRSLAAQAKGSVLNTSYITHTTTTDVDGVQVNLAFPAGLVQFNDKGKKKSKSVTIEIGYRLVGAPTWTTTTPTYTSNKTETLRFTRELVFPTRGTYEVRVRRTTSESTDDKVYDSVTLVEVVEVQASNVALRGVANGWYRIKMTDQLSNIPQITWKVKGVKVNQYDAAGNVVTNAWTDNPAWIVLDMLNGPTRGAFPTIPIDYQAFFDWAQYCETNSFKFNGVFDETMSLWDCLGKVYKIGRAMPIRIGTKVSVAIDKPSDPVMLFTAGNIEKDTFTINYLPLSDRANEFEVSFYDKTDNNKKKTIRIVDPDAEARGELPRPVQYELFGVDNHEQAEKEVWYQLYQNRLTRKTITFSAPIESIALTLGDVALIQHDMVDWGISGRIKQGLSTTQLILDKDVTAADGDTIMVIFDEVGGETDVIEERTIQSIDELTNTVTVTVPFSQVPQDLHNYMLGHAGFVKRPFRLRSISGNDLESRELTFVEYNPLIYSAPETPIPAPDAKALVGIVPQVTDLDFTDTVDYTDTIEKDVITTVGWTSGHIPKYAGADVYVATIAQEDYDLGQTTPEYELYQTVNNANTVKVVAEYDDYVFVKVVAFDTDGKRAIISGAPSIFALVADPVTVPAPTAITDGSAFAYTVNGSAKISFEFLYNGVIADIDGFYLDVQYSSDSGFASSKTERFILTPTQRAIILGNARSTDYYRFSVTSFKRVHDIFSETGIATSTTVNAFEYPYRPSDNTAFAGVIEDSITTSNPYIALLDFVNFTPTSEEPALVTLTKPVVTVPTDDAGENPDLSNTGTDIEVRQGDTALAYDGLGGTAGTWTITGITATNCVAGTVTDSGTAATLSALSSITTGTTVRTAQLQIDIAGQSLGGNTFNLRVVQSINKALGANIDTTPPSIPTNLALTSEVIPDAVTGIPRIKLIATWTASPETDTAGYVLAIKEGTGNFVEFKLDKDTRFEVDAGANVLYTAKIKAYDTTGNISAFTANATHTTAKDTTPPALPTGLTATASFRNIFLNWVNPADADVAAIEIYENTTNNSGTATLISVVNAEPSQAGAFTRSGLSSNVQRYYWLKAVDTSGNKSAFTTSVNATTARAVDADITDGVISAAKFTSTIKPVEIVSTLPTTGLVAGRVVYLTTDSKLYRYSGSAWISTVPTTDLTGTISTVQIADNAITTAKFASSIAPVEIVSALPTTGNYEGRTVYLTTDKKLYRYNGTSFIASVASSDITGTLADAQIASLAASKVTGTLTDAQIASLAAAKLTGQITTTQITDDAITTAKVAANAITASEIAANTITANEIAANAITTSELNAGAVTTAKIAAGAVTANEIAANTITGNKIAANTITGSNIAADTITAGQIAAGAISASEIATDAVTTDKIAANAINSTKIVSNAITADKIAANSVTTDKVAANAITANKLQLKPSGFTINADPSLSDTTLWSIPSETTVVTDADFLGGRAFSKSTSFGNIYSEYIPIDRNKTYRLSMSAKSSVGSDRTNYNLVAFYDANYVQINGTANPFGWSSVGTFHYYGLVGQVPPTTVTEYGITFGNGQTAGIPTNARYVRIGALINYTGTTGTTYYGSFKLQEVMPAELIVDGAITTNKLAANSVVAGKVAAGAISASNITANAITAKNLLVAGQNVINNPKFDTGDLTGWRAWQNVGNQSVIPLAAMGNRYWLRHNGSGAATTIGTFAAENPYNDTGSEFDGFEVNPGDEYLVNLDSFESAGSTGNLYLAFYYMTHDGNKTGGSATVLRLDGGGSDFGPLLSDSGTTLTGKFTVPSNAVRGWLYIYSVNLNGNYYFTNVNVRLRNSANLIVDGAIVADKIAANAVTATKIAASAITADKIQAGTITGDKFNTGTNLPGTITVGSTGVSIETVRNQAGSGFSIATDGLIFADTRNDNFSPDYYYSKKTNTNINTTAEFKTNSVIGLTASGVGTFSKVITTAQWSDSSGGPVHQEARDGQGRLWNRHSTSGTTWSAWMDGGEQVNRGVTKILPGQITVSGSTTLANWRNGSDTTKIEGGSIAANTISANKIELGARGITIEGIEFEANRSTVGGSVVNNTLAWSAGSITYINDAGAPAAHSISAGSSGLWSSGTFYIYWVKGASTLSTTNSAGTANGANNIIIATYSGGTNVTVTYGRTIIDGSKITTGTIAANKLNVGTLSAITAQIGTLRTASSGARLEISDNVIKVFDASGVKRVQLGNLTL